MSLKTDKLTQIILSKILKEINKKDKNIVKLSKLWKPELKDPIKNKITESKIKIETYQEILKVIDNL